MNWSIVWVIMGRRGVSSECRRSSCSSYLCHKVKVVSSSLLVHKFVCSFVCLLATLWKNAWTDFHEIVEIY